MVMYIIKFEGHYLLDSMNLNFSDDTFGEMVVNLR